jgi:predicted nicotinamide N-methyase
MTSANVSRQRRHLLARIHRRYQTREQLLQIGPLALQFTSIADPNRVLEDAAAQESQESAAAAGRPPAVPYWAELWDSATGLAHWLIERFPPSGPAHSPPPPAVLDLGCGMGLSGVSAAALGAQVTFADLETLPLIFARLNSLPWKERVEARRVDWRTDAMGRNFDLILGADILYERAEWEYLDRFWKLHLAPAGTIALGEPGRQTGEAFVDWIAAQGWTLQESSQTAGPDKKKIRVLALRRG